MGRERFAEVAIVGGGVMGASIAAHLAERKVGRVVVFEREDALAGGDVPRPSGERGSVIRQTVRRAVAKSPPVMLQLKLAQLTSPGSRPGGVSPVLR